MSIFERWTPEQVQTLRNMKAAGARLAEIAVALNTTLTRVKTRMCWEKKTPEQREQRNRNNCVFRKKKSQHWSPAELETARCLVQNRATNEECLAAVGRTFHACYVKLDRDAHSPRARPTPKPVLAPGALEAAAARLSAPRTLTAWMCGDPAPGCCALDQRENRA